MHKNYKLDDPPITSIKHRHTKPIEHLEQFQFFIYNTKFKERLGKCNG